MTSVKRLHLPENIWQQQTRKLWRWDSWDWGGSADRRPPSRLGLCLSWWPTNEIELWLHPQTPYLRNRDRNELWVPLPKLSQKSKQITWTSSQFTNWWLLYIWLYDIAMRVGSKHVSIMEANFNINLQFSFIKVCLSFTLGKGRKYF